MFAEIPKIDKIGLRRFGLVSSLVLCIIFGLFIPLLRQEILPVWPWIFGICLILVALYKPSLLHPIYQAWMRFGIIVGTLNTVIILGIIFYCLVTPMSLFFKGFSYDPLARKLNSSVSSYRKMSQHRSPMSLEKPY